MKIPSIDLYIYQLDWLFHDIKLRAVYIELMNDQWSKIALFPHPSQILLYSLYGPVTYTKKLRIVIRQRLKTKRKKILKYSMRKRDWVIRIRYV